MSGTLTTDVVVVGLGAVGAACLYQLAKQGVRAIGIDRYAPPHDLGSSHGETRITRLGVGEGPEYGPLVRRAHEIWRELEADVGESLLLTCGALIVGPSDGQTPHHGRDDFVRRSQDAARAHGVVHEMLDADEIARRYPQMSPRGDEIGYFEPSGGLVYPERCIAAQLAQAQRLGARVLTGEAVTRLEDRADGVTVSTPTGRVQAAMAVVTAGAWSPGLLGGPLRAMAIQPQTLHWFETRDPAAYGADRFPVFIWMHGPGAEDVFYGFPIAPGAQTKAVKAAQEYFVDVAEPDAMDRIVRPGEAEQVWRRHLDGRLIGVGPRAIRSARCLYTTAPDADFAIGFQPGRPRVLAASACSGHGFKHSAGVGELLARVAASQDATLIPDRFNMSRPALGQPAGQTT